MTPYQKINKNLDIKKGLNHDVREQKVSNRLLPKDLKKGSENK